MTWGIKTKDCEGIGVVEREVAESWLERLLLLIQEGRRQLRKTQSLITYVGILGLVLLAVTFSVYLSGGAKTSFPNLFYLPIVITGVVKGRAWGSVTGLVSGLLCGPLMPSDVVAGVMQETGNWMLRAAFFAFTGYISGISSSLLLVKNRQLLRTNAELDTTLKELTSSFARTIDAKDPYTANHAEKVAEYSVWLGKEIGLSSEQLEDLYKAGILHDIGKIGIPDNILKKPGRLTTEEFELVKQHPEYGHDILRPIAGLQKCAEMVLYHHKGIDGSGYPGDIGNGHVPLGARILAIADAWDAMTSDRTYRKALSREEAIKQLSEGSGTQFDPLLAAKFIEMVSKESIVIDQKQSGRVHNDLESSRP